MERSGVTMHGTTEFKRSRKKERNRIRYRAAVVVVVVVVIAVVVALLLLSLSLLLVNIVVLFVAAVAVLSVSRSLPRLFPLHFRLRLSLSLYRFLHLVLLRSLRELFRMPRSRRYFRYVKNASIESRQRAHSPSRRRPFSQSEASTSNPDLSRRSRGARK